MKFYTFKLPKFFGGIVKAFIASMDKNKQQ